MTLQELIQAVRSELLEPSPGFWTDAEITRWLNEANRDLTRAAEIEAEPHTWVTTPGQASYGLPPNFWQVRRLTVNDAPVWPVAVDEALPGQGVPVGFYLWEGQLYLTPVPDGAYTARLWYFRDGNTLSSPSDVPVIPEGYHHLLVFYAVAQARRKGEDPAYTTYAADYAAGKLQMVQELQRRRQGGRFPTVLDLDSVGW